MLIQLVVTAVYITLLLHRIVYSKQHSNLHSLLQFGHQWLLVLTCARWFTIPIFCRMLGHEQSGSQLAG